MTRPVEHALGPIFRSTIEALLAPRRLIPITVVILPLLFLQVNYSYTNTTNLFGNYSANITPRVGVALSDYSAGPNTDSILVFNVAALNGLTI